MKHCTVVGSVESKVVLIKCAMLCSEDYPQLFFFFFSQIVRRLYKKSFRYDQLFISGSIMYSSKFSYSGNDHRSVFWPLLSLTGDCAAEKRRPCSFRQSLVDYGNIKLTQRALKRSEYLNCWSWTQNTNTVRNAEETKVSELDTSASHQLHSRS